MKKNCLNVVFAAIFAYMPAFGLTEPERPDAPRQNDAALFLRNCIQQKEAMQIAARAYRAATERRKRHAEEYAKAKAAEEERAEKEQAELESKVSAEQKAKDEKERAERREARLREILGEGLYRSSKRKTLSGPVPILRPEPRPAKIKIWR